jgi:hypothetical protein
MKNQSDLMKRYQCILLFAILLVLLAPSSKVLAQWVQTKGLQGESITSLLVSGSRLFAGTGSRWGHDGNGVFVSTDDGASWSAASAGLKYGYYKGDVTCLAAIKTSASSTILFAGTDTGVYHSVDNGTNWLGWNTGLPQECFVTAFATVGTNLFAAAAGGGSTQSIFLSTDNGIGWSALYSGLHTSSAFALAMRSGWLYAGTSNGVFLSPSDGMIWGQANNGLTDTLVIAIALSDTNASSRTLFAGTIGGGAFRSRNNALSWSAINSGLPINTTVNTLFVNGPNLFAGTQNGGVYLSTDDGTSWQNVSTGLKDSSVTALVVSHGMLFAGSGNTGVWRRPLSEMIGSNGVARAPRQTQTVSIYPNPVSHEAKINFSFRRSGPATVTIHDLLGREVAKLFDGPLEAGEHSYTWDAKMMPAGVYSIRLQTAGQAQLCPMVIVR